MTNNEMPSMESLAPLIDRLRKIADEEIPHPQTLEIRAWEDGDFEIYIYHQIGSEEREQILYDGETDEAMWQRRKAPSTQLVEVEDGADARYETQYEESEERQIDLEM